MKIRQVDIKGEVYDIEAYENPIPTGSVFPFPGITAPEGFLLCNGQEVSRFTYAKLYKVLGDTYGAGDGLTTFNLPDYREVTLVGAGQNEKLSITKHDVYNIGEFKDDQFQGHKHSNRGQVSSGSSDGKYKAQITEQTKTVNETTGNPITDGVNEIPRVGSTTHGKQIGINFIIKV